MDYIIKGPYTKWLYPYGVATWSYDQFFVKFMDLKPFIFEGLEDLPIYPNCQINYYSNNPSHPPFYVLSGHYPIYRAEHLIEVIDYYYTKIARKS